MGARARWAMDLGRQPDERGRRRRMSPHLSAHKSSMPQRAAGAGEGVSVGHAEHDTGPARLPPFWGHVVDILDELRGRGTVGSKGSVCSEVCSSDGVAGEEGERRAAARALRDQGPGPPDLVLVWRSEGPMPHQKAEHVSQVPRTAAGRR